MRNRWRQWGLKALGLALWLAGGAMSRVHAEDSPQWLGPERDGVWRETGLIEQWPTNGPAVRWRTKIYGGYSSPAVLGDRLYLSDFRPWDPKSVPANPFDRGVVRGMERVYTADLTTGRILWIWGYEAAYTMSYPAGPRATPVVDTNSVYALGGEGHLNCLNTKDGSMRWVRQLGRDFQAKTPTWGYSASPLLDGQKLICLVGGPGSTVVAFNKANGRELWRALDAKEPGYAPPVIYTIGGKRQLIVWHPEAVNGLDPETGAVLWTHPWPIREGLTIAMPRQDGSRLFLSAFYNGSLMLDLESGAPKAVYQSPKVSEKDTAMLHSLLSTPQIAGDYIYGVCSYGQLRCLKKANGERVWETYQATTGENTRWGNAFLVRQGDTDRYWIFNEKGDLILARLTEKGYEELGRSHVIEPTNRDPGRPVVWSQPAFARRSLYVRNDQELISVNLAADQK